MARYQDALKAYEERKKKEEEDKQSSFSSKRDKINSAVSKYEERQKSGAKDAVSSLVKRINEEIAKAQKISTPKWGEGSLGNTLSSTRESRVNIENLQRELEAYKSYIGEAEYKSMADAVKSIYDTYDNYLKVADVRSQFKSENDYNKYSDGWLVDGAETTAETVAKRQGYYKGNQDRIDSINDELPWYANTWLPNFIEDIFLSKDKEALRDEAEALKSENLKYDRTQGVTDKYYTPVTDEFKQNAAYRNYSNATREELWNYDMTESEGSVALSSGGYFDEEGNIRDRNGKIVRYANGPEIQDKLGMFLSAVEDGTAMEYVNELAATGGNYTNTWGNLMQEGDVNGWRYLEPHEIDIYYDLYKREGQAAAYKFLDDMATELTRRETRKREEYINEAPFLEQIALNLASIPMGVIGGAVGLASDASDLLKGEDINPYSRWHLFSNDASAVRSDTAKDINNLTGNAALPLVGTTWGDVYQSLMSGADSFMASFIPGGHYLLAANAASSEMKGLYERGASTGQMLAGGLLAGAAEAVFEKFSIGELNKLKNMDTKSVKNFFQGFVRATVMGGVEATEEMATEIANTITDALVMGSQSDWVDFGTFVKNVVNAGIGGLISGGAMGGVASAINHAQYNKQATEYGQAIIDEGGQESIDALKQLALEMYSDKGGLDALSGVKAVNKVADKASAKNVGRLYSQMEGTVTAEGQTVIRDALVEKGLSKREASLLSAYLTNSNEISERQVADIESNERYQAIMDEVLADPNLDISADSMKLALARNGVQTSKAPAQQAKPHTRQEETTAQQDEAYVRQVAEATGMDATAVAQGFARQAKDTSVTENTPVEQIATEGKFKASETGKTIVMTTGKEVSIEEIVSNDGGNLMVKLDNGETVNASDLAFATAEEGVVYEMVAKMGVNPKTAMALVKAYNPSSGVKAQTYAIDIPLAYQYGKIGYQKGLKRLNLTTEQSAMAYVLGRDDVKASGRTWSDTSKKTLDTNKSKAADDSIIYEGFELHEDGLHDIQKASLAGIRTLAKMSPSLEFHVYQSIVENGKKYAVVNGKKIYTPNGFFRNGNEIYLDINAGQGTKGAMLYTSSHEVVHFIAENSFEDFQALADFLFEHYGENNVPVDQLIDREINKLKKAYKAEGKKMPSEPDLYMKAYEEVVANAMSKMLADPKSYEKLAKLKSENLTLWEKIGEAIKRMLDKLKSMLGIYEKHRPDQMAADYVDDFTAEVYEQLQDLYIKAFVNAQANYEASIGSRNLADFADAKNTEGDTLFQYQAMEADEDTYRDMLKKWGKMTDTQINNLFLTIDNAMELIKDNLEALDYAWDADIDDRAFAPVKPNSDKLYQVSLDFSTLCRKRILQQTVAAQLQEALNKPLTREEGIAIRDALIALQEEGRQIEVACALCYVEPARMKSPEQIKRFIENREAVIKEFFAGKSGGDIKAKIKQAEADAREKLHKENPNGIKGKDGKTMLDPREAKLNTLPKKYADEIREAKRGAKQSYAPTAEEQRIIEVAKGMSVSDFTSPEGLENLAKNYPSLFDAYTSYIRNATKSKGIENDTWWRAGDSMQIGDVLIANMNKENGLRSQSWSDFQVVHILDYIASTIELATRETKEQAYSKVPDYVELMGNTGVMINMSLIPTAQFNGTLDYDSVEGIDYKRALELRDKYHATAGTICIGVDNVQIKLLLEDITIDYVIPYHKSGMSAAIRKLMHIPTWSQYEEYQSEKNLSRTDAENQAKKYGVKLLDASDPNYHKGTSFSEWFDLKEAQQIAKMENANPSDKAKQKKYGVMYGGYMAMQNAANNYLKLCAERGISPKFSHEKADFTAEDNYWKLLIDRKMVDNVTGDVIEQKTIKPIFDEKEVMRILNDELERYPKVKADQDYAIRKVTEGMLSGAIKGGMSAKDIAKVMQTPVDNVTNVNIFASTEGDTLYSVDDDFYDEYDAWDRKDANKTFTVGRTSDVLKSIGMKDQEIKLHSGTVLNKVNKHPEISFDTFRDIPELLEHPIIVQFSDAIDPATKQPKYESRITVLGELYGDNGKPVLVSLELLPTNKKKTTILDVSVVVSAYAKGALQNYLSENSILYIDSNKKRTNNWLSLNRLQLPVGENQVGSVRSIAYVDGKVKVQNKKNMTPMQIALQKAGLVDDFGNLTEDFDEVHSDQDTDSVSTRSLLANALESVAQNDIERNKLKEYKSKIALIESEYEKLTKIQAELRELSFPPKGTKKDTDRINALRFEEKQTANRINTYDRQLLNLESTKALKDVFEREKEMARRKEAKKGKEVLARYREQAAKTQRALMEKHTESRKKAIEGRKKTEMRHKIRNVVKDLDKLLNRGTKERNVKEELRGTVSTSLKLAELLFNNDIQNADIVRLGVDSVTEKENQLLAEYSNLLDTIDALAEKREYFEGTETVREKLLAKIGSMEEEIAKAKNKISRLNNQLSDVFERERARLNKATADQLMGSLASEYLKLKESESDYIRAAYDEYIYNRLDVLKKDIGGTPVRDMSMDQLAEVYDAYKMVEHFVRDANKAFKAQKGETISMIANGVIAELDAQKKSPKVVKGLDKWSQFDWNNLKPVYAFERIGSANFTKVFNAVRAGEDVWAVDMSDARAFLEAQKKKHGYDKLDFGKGYDFTSSTGHTFTLRLDQIMSLYAYSKRGEQAKNHLKYGGFQFDGVTEVKEKKGKILNITYQLKDSTAYKLSDKLLADIIGVLENEDVKGAKAFVDEMQEYLSSTMGDKGNEVSLELYGVKLFKEENYFPLRVSQDFLERAREQAMGEVKIKNSGFSQATVPNAKNPIVLSSFMDVWAGHVNEMSMYHAFVLPMEDFYRVFNYGTPADEKLDSMSVVSSLRGAHRDAAVNYVDQLLKDLNGGARSDPRETPFKAVTSNFKKAAVMASWSVVIQQPSAMVRAMALVDSKYFAGKKVAKGKHKEMWAEVKKYAPIAVIKEMGYFDTGMGKGSVEWLKGEKNWKDVLDDAVSWAPAFADEVTWIGIWNAVKRETLHTHKHLAPNSDAFLKAVGERFTEVITKTQVYDSTLSRSANMRAKGEFMNMLTSFMAEPTTSINMLQDAIQKGNKKYIARAMGAVYGSVILNSALVSLIYAMRDDDEDETFLEKYLSRLTTEIIDGVNPLTYIPFFKDIWSVAQGFDIERADMALITTMFDSLQQMVKVISKDTSDMDEDELAEHKKSFAEALLSIADNTSSLFGVPVKNVRRDINGIINGVKTIVKDVGGRKTTAGSLADNILEDVKDSVPVWGWFPDESKGDKLYDAIVKGDKAYVDRLKGSYKSDTAYESAVRKSLRENDSRIHDAAVARFAGRNDEYMRIVREIKAEGKFTQDTIVAAINSEISSMKPDKESSIRSPKMWTVDDYYNSIVHGDTGTASTIKDALVKEKLAEGYLTGEAKASIESSFATEVKDAYMAGDITKSKAESLLTTYGGKDKDEAKTEIKKCDFELQNGVAWSERARAYRLGKISESKLITAVMEIEGESREAAEEYIRFLDLEMANPDVDITASDASAYFEYAEPAGINVDVFMEYRERTSGLESDKDQNGNSISGTKKAKIMAVINSLPISSSQKDALYFANNWAASNLYEAPWH